MATPYKISGPTSVGDTAKLTEILGNISLPQTNGSPTQGDVFFRGASGYLTSISPGTFGYVLSTQGPGANPVWVPNGVGATVLSSCCRYTGSQTIGTSQTRLFPWDQGTFPCFNDVVDFNAATGLLTSTTVSVYNVNCSVTYFQSVTGGTRTLAIRVNGAIQFEKQYQPTANASMPQTIEINANVSIAIGDTIDVVMLTDAGVTLTIQPGMGTWIAITKY